jgi:putative metallopeptidase DUF4344
MSGCEKSLAVASLRGGRQQTPGKVANPILRTRRFVVVGFPFVAATLGLALVVSGAAVAAPKARQIQIEYVAPINAEHQSIHDTLKKARALEYIQSVLGSIRLPRPLKIRLEGCEGISNAWYGNGEVTVCYEYVADIFKNAAEADLPMGITRQDTIIGPLADVFLHEAGHAIFDYLRVPLFGREEDAADQFSSYIMLQYDKERSRKLILGSAYQYKMDLKETKAPLAVTQFADEHGLPAQRFYNILCIAYGSDPKLFADLLTQKYLPEDRAGLCEGEYHQVRYAFQTLIGRNVDRRAAKRAFKQRNKFKSAF